MRLTVHGEKDKGAIETNIALKLQQWADNSVMVVIIDKATGEEVARPYLVRFEVREGKIQVVLESGVNPRVVHITTKGGNDVARVVS